MHSIHPCLARRLTQGRAEALLAEARRVRPRQEHPPTLLDAIVCGLRSGSPRCGCGLPRQAAGVA